MPLPGTPLTRPEMAGSWDIHFLIGKPEPSSTTRPSFLGSAFPHTSQPLSLHRYTVSVVGIHLASRHLPPVFFFFFFLRLICRICRTCRFRRICVSSGYPPPAPFLGFQALITSNVTNFLSFLFSWSCLARKAQPKLGRAFSASWAQWAPELSPLQRTDIYQNISYVRNFLSRALSGPSHAELNKIFINFMFRNNWLIHWTIYYIA